MTANQAPTSFSLLYLTDEDTPYEFQEADFPYHDADGDPLQTIIIESVPQSGVLRLAGVPIRSGQVISASTISQLAFVPPLDANGLPFTTFDFRVSDGLAYSALSKGTLLVRPISDMLYLPSLTKQQ